VASSLLKTVVEELAQDGGEWQEATAAAWCELAAMSNSLHRYEEGLKAARTAIEIYEKRGLGLLGCFERQAALSQELHAVVRLRRDTDVIKACRQGRTVLSHTLPPEWGPEADAGALPGSPPLASMCSLVGEMCEAYR